MKMRTLVTVFAVFALLATSAFAYQGKPPKSDELNVVGVDQIALETLPKVDVRSLLLEDLGKSADKPGTPYRVAEEVAVSFSPKAHGTWEEVADGARLWRLRVASPGAVFTSFLLENFELPWGAELRFVSVDREHFVGPYTLRNNNSEKMFRSPAVAGDSAFLELYLPAGVDAPRFRIAAVSHGYRDFHHFADRPVRPGRDIAFEKSLGANLPADFTAKALACEVDVACPDGNGWENEISSVARTFDGRFLCTGQLLNNIREDCRNLFLTANHCLSKSRTAQGLVFYWNYENSSCGSGDASLDQTTTGSTLLATASVSDFTLVELTEAPPESFGVYHSGFDASGAQPTSGGIAIHHPAGDEKKISFEFDAVVDGQSSGWGNDHWRVEGWDVGTTEGGSSGGALWNTNHRVVGQLHGGTADCSGGWDEYGKLSVSWTNGLSAHLDPDATGTQSIAGQLCTGGGGDPPPACQLGQAGDPCSANSDCCSNSCKGKPGNKTCK